MQFHTLSRLVLVLALAAGLASPLISAERSRVGVLFMERVFERAQSFVAQGNALKAQVETVQVELNRLVEEARRLERLLGTFPADSPQYVEHREQLEVLKLRIKLYRERHTDRVQRLETELLRQAFRDVRAALGEFAAERGLDVILMGRDGDPDAERMMEFRFELFGRVVLWQRADADITDAFITFFDARRPPGATAPVPETGSSPAIDLGAGNP